MKRLVTWATIAVTVVAIAGWCFGPNAAAQTTQSAPASKTIVVPPGMEGIYEGMHYAPAVRIGDMVIVSGIPAGGPGTYEDQLRRMFGRIKAILGAAGATMEDVVELQSFHTSATDGGAFNDEFKRFSAVHREVFTSHYPAWTATGNAALLAPGAKVEVRVVAMVGSGRNATTVGGVRASSTPPATGSVPALEYFTGTWLVHATDPRNNEQIRVRYAVRPAVGGKWYLGAADVLSSADESQDVWGQDPKSSDIVRTIFDSSGVYAVVRSRGWNRETMVLEGDCWTPQGVLKVRETITRLSRDEFKAVWELFRDGAWVPYSIEKVTREKG